MGSYFSTEEDSKESNEIDSLEQSKTEICTTSTQTNENVSVEKPISISSNTREIEPVVTETSSSYKDRLLFNID